MEKSNIEIIDVNMLNEDCYSLAVRHPDFVLKGVRVYRSPGSLWKIIWEWGRHNSESMIVTLSEKIKEPLENPILKLFIPIESNLARDRERRSITGKIQGLERRQDVLKYVIADVKELEIPTIERTISQLQRAIEKNFVELAVNPGTSDVFKMPGLEKDLEATEKKLRASRTKLEALTKESELISGSLVFLQGELDSLSIDNS